MHGIAARAYLEDVAGETFKGSGHRLLYFLQPIGDERALDMHVMIGARGWLRIRPTAAEKDCARQRGKAHGARPF